MIGNKIEFVWYGYDGCQKGKEYTGIVVDAFTEVSGEISGNSGTFLGFGSGETSGKTRSKRMYKVEFYGERDREKKYVKYEDIYASQLKKIISFAGPANQEVNEEKLQINN